MLTNANKGTYLVKNWQKYANVIYERPLTLKRVQLWLYKTKTGLSSKMRPWLFKFKVL